MSALPLQKSVLPLLDVCIDKIRSATEDWPEESLPQLEQGLICALAIQADFLAGCPDAERIRVRLLATRELDKSLAMLHEFSCSHALLESLDLSGGGKGNLTGEIFHPLLTYFLPIEAEQFGIAYEMSTRLHRRKMQGLYYTPAPVADYMITRLLQNTDSSKLLLQNASFLDPSCGCGMFLLRLLRYLNRNVAPGEMRAYAEQSVFGVDRNRFAVGVTRFSIHQLFRTLIGETLSSTALQGSIQFGNSLLTTTDLRDVDDALTTKLHPFDWDVRFAGVFDNGGFSYIIGNPPYGLARDERIPGYENAILKSVYSEHRIGKINTYLLSLISARSLLRSNGSLSFLIPNAWHGLQTARHLRDRWLRSEEIEEISVFTGPIFEHASVESTVIQLRRGQNRSFAIHTVSYDARRKAVQMERQMVLSHKLCRTLPDSLIPLSWRPGMAEIWSQIYENSFPLHCMFRPMIALQVYARGKGTPAQSKDDVMNHVFHSDQRLSGDCHPYLKGSDVRPFVIHWSGQYLRYGPWIAEPQSPERYCCPRVVIREVISKPPHVITAAFLDGCYFYNKSILHILPSENASTDHLKALTAVLSSTMASFIIRAVGRKAQRKVFPKVVNADLRDFPLPVSFHHFSLQLSRSTDQLSQAIRQRDSDQKISSLFRQLDDQVFEAYGFSRLESKRVKTFLGSKTLNADGECLFPEAAQA